MQHDVPSPRLLLVRFGLLVTTATILAPLSTSAEEFTWTGGGSNTNWGNASNWDRLAPLPNDGTADLDFLNVGTSASSHAETSYSIHSLSFDRLASAYTISGEQLTLGAGGITQNALAAQTIQNAIVVGIDQTWRFGQDSAPLTLSGGVSLGSGSRTLTLEAAGASVNATFTGANAKLVKTGAGTLTYGGVGSSIPLGEVNSGSLVVASGASFLTTNFTVNAGGNLVVNGTINSPNSYLILSGDATSVAHTLLASGGSLTTSYTGIGTNARFTHTGGTHTVNSLTLEGTAAQAGRYTLTGGTLAGNDVQVGYSSYGSFSQSGGSHTATTLTLGNVVDTGNGVYNLGGSGQLTTTNTLVGKDGLGVFTQTGVTHTVTQGLYLGQNGGRGTYTLSGGLVDANQTFVVGDGSVFNLDGGTLRTSLVILGPNPTFNFNGGTLQSTADNSELVRFPGDVIVRSGGAVVDSNGHTIGLRTILKHDPALGTTADGGLTKTGAGTLVLTGIGYSGETTGNTYTGATKVNAGTLLVNNTHGSGTGSGNVTVNSTGTLGGTGTISGAVAVASGGTLAPGTSVGTLRTGNLSLASGGTVLFELDSTSNIGADRINVTGTVNLNGGNIVLSLLSEPSLGRTFVVLQNDGTDPITGVFAQGGTVAGTFNGSTYLFAIHYGANNDGGAIGNDIALVTVAVPEPSTYAFALLGAGLLASLQYFRRGGRR